MTLSDSMVSSSPKNGVYRVDENSLFVFEGEDVWILDEGRWMHLAGKFAAAARAAFASNHPEPMLTRLASTGMQGASRLAHLLQSPKTVLPTSLLVEKPSLLFMELTSHCNLSCRHCYGNSGPARESMMSRETAVSLIESAHQLEYQRIQFTGGEPLSHPYLAELVAAAHKAAIPGVEVYTNGTMLSADFLDPIPDDTSFALSFYSHQSAVHDAITGRKGSWQATLNGIDLLMARGFKLRISVIIMAENEGDWVATREFLLNRGLTAEQIQLGTSSQVGRGDFFSASKISGEFCRDDGNRDDDDDTRHDLYSWTGKVAISADGDVFPCIFARWMRLGNVHDRALKDILMHPEPRTEVQLSVPERWEYCSRRLSCPDCRSLVFGIMGSKI